MTIQKAIKMLFASERFKEDAKKNANLRVYLGRYNKGLLKKGAVLDLLEKYDYRIEVKEPNK